MTSYQMAHRLPGMSGPRPGPLARVRSGLLLAIAALVATLVMGNVTIVSVHLWAQRTTGLSTTEAPAGLHNFVVVDGKVMRGSRPTEASYRALAARGVTTVVDLRAEEGLDRPMALLDRLGIDLVRIPMRDGQAPSARQVDRFMAVVGDSTGKVYVHCMAGVGRTGTMVAAYLVEKRDVEPLDALRLNMAVGPPSLEQIAFAVEADEPNPLLVGLSRVLDAPRRAWTYVN